MRHHRELDVYTLTSESEAHHEPPFPGDRCTGHIFKLRNIQQQLMKTNLKQMDNPMPLMVTAQDPSGVPAAQDTDSQCLCCASAPRDGQQRPLPEDTASSPCCPGSTAGGIASSCDLSGVAKEEHTDCSCGRRTAGVERKGEEVEAARAEDCGAASGPSHCLQSVPDCGGKGAGGVPCCGLRNGETGTESAALAADQESPGAGDHVPQGDVAMQPSTAAIRHLSGGELAVGVPVTAGDPKCDLGNTDTPTQKNVLEAGGSTGEEVASSGVSTAGACDGRGPRKPTGEAGAPHGVPATASLEASRPVECSPAGSNREASTVKTAETETSRGCEGGAGVPPNPSPPVLAAAAEDTPADGFEPCAPLAGASVPASPSGLTFPGPPKRHGKPGARNGFTSHPKPKRRITPLSPRWRWQAVCCLHAAAGHGDFWWCVGCGTL